MFFAYGVPYALLAKNFSDFYQYLCLPIIAVASVIRIATIAVINCGAYLLGPVMSFLLFGIVYTVCMQQWNQAAVFVILEVACGFLLYATAAIAATSQSIADGLLGFIRQ